MEPLGYNLLGGVCLNVEIFLMILLFEDLRLCTKLHLNTMKFLGPRVRQINTINEWPNKTVTEN